MTSRRRSPLAQLARDSHLISRAAGDVEAFRTGGAPRLLTRIARRQTVRRGFSLLRKF